MSETEKTPAPTARQAADAAHGLADLAMSEVRQLRTEVAAVRSGAEAAARWSSAALVFSVVVLAGVAWVVVRLNGGKLPVLAFRVPDTIAGL